MHIFQLEFNQLQNNSVKLHLLSQLVDCIQLLNLWDSFHLKMHVVTVNSGSR